MLWFAIRKMQTIFTNRRNKNDFIYMEKIICFKQCVKSSLCHDTWSDTALFECKQEEKFMSVV